MVKDSFSEPKNKRELNISTPIYFEKNPAHDFVGFICTNKGEGFFFRKNFFSRTAARLIWASFFPTKK